MSSIGSMIDEFLSAPDLPARLAEALRESHRGGSARVRMSPSLSYGRHAGPAPFDARHAAVTLLLFKRDGRWHVPLTERPQTLTRHCGQISLPGGSIDAGETSEQAALRELAEELGVQQSVELVGRLADCYIYASNFLVIPWIAATKSEPLWRPHDREVQRIFELPLETLFDDSAIGETTITRGPLNFHAPCISVSNTCVWGATSVILGELADVLSKLAGFEPQRHKGTKSIQF
jgi:8-oxo-dGTP pyrophosphatase MutT (NUDIX family)